MDRAFDKGHGSRIVSIIEFYPGLSSKPFIAALDKNCKALVWNPESGSMVYKLSNLALKKDVSYDPGKPLY